MTLSQAFSIASRNIGGEMESSSLLCLHNASVCMDKELYNFAWVNIIKSLAYSVGVSHTDYISVREAYDVI